MLRLSVCARLASFRHWWMAMQSMTKRMKWMILSSGISINPSLFFLQEIITYSINAKNTLAAISILPIV